MICKACKRPARWAPDELGEKCRRKERAKAARLAVARVSARTGPVVDGQGFLFDLESQLSEGCNNVEPCSGR